MKHRAELYKLLPEGSVAVEIGVAEANFSRDILNWPNIKKLYSVDSWTTLNQKGDGGYDQAWHDKNYQDAVNRLKPFGERSQIIRSLSVAASKGFPDESIDFIHLDGDHSYDGVMNDLNAWFPKIVCVGIISGHDFLRTEYGVQRAVTDFCKDRFEVFTIPENKTEDSGFYFVKTCW